MGNLRFSVADHFGNGQALFARVARLGGESAVAPEVQDISWQLMWSYLQRSLLAGDGFDVSEIGSSWVAGFAEMDFLSELMEADVKAVGGADRFLPSAWQSVSLMNSIQLFAVPFMADTRVVYYWRDMLDEAGVDEREAFETPVRMEATVRRLSEAGKPTWAAPTFAVTNVVHQIASWIWGAGGSFFNEDQTQTAFCSDAALGGIISYFTLQKYMTRKYDSLDSVLDAFRKRTAAVIMSGPWFYQNLLQRSSPDAGIGRLGLALPPGPPFVGGSSLVIWRGARQRRDDALRWIELLTSPPVQAELTRITGLLPVVKDVVSSAPYTTDPHYAIFGEALQKGNPLPRLSYWGPLEAELVRTFGNIWSDLKEDPRYTPKKAVLEHLIPMASMFDGKLYRRSLLPH